MLEGNMTNCRGRVSSSWQGMWESGNLERLMNLRMLQDGAIDSEFQWLL